MTEDRIVKIDLRVDRRHLPGCLEMPSSPEDANWNKNEPKDKDPGQDQIKDNAQVWVSGAAMPEDVNDPEAIKTRAEALVNAPPIRLNGLFP